MTPQHVVQLTDTLITLFDPLVQAIDDLDYAEALLKEMGYQAPGGIAFLNDFSPLFGSLIDLADQADDLLGGDTDPDYLALFRSLIDAIQDIVKLISDIGDTLHANFPADFLAATDMAAQLPRQLADYLVVRMLERRYPVLHSTLLVTGIIDQREVTTAATPFNTPYIKRVIRWEKLGDYLGSPLSSMQQAYGWNTENFDYDILINNLHRFGQSVRLFTSLANPEPDTLRALNGGVDVVTEDNADKLGIVRIPLLPVLDAQIGAEIYPVLNASKNVAAGLGLGLYFDPSGGLSFPITDRLALGIGYTAAAPLDAGILILPGQPLQSVSNIFGGSGPQVDLSAFIPEFTYSNNDQKTLLFETSVGKLEFASWALRAGVLAGMSGLYIETEIRGATLTIGAGQGDGFLQDVLPAQPMQLDFEITIGFSTKAGLYFGGSLDLQVTLPAHISIGPVELQAITVSLKPAKGKIPLDLGADIALSLGPLHVVVRNMGIEAILSFPPNRDGNLGPTQVDFGFKTPSGAGLSIDTAGVSGGGFLAYGDARHEYSGLLQLSFIDLALQAFGLITTQVAGTSGYSLLALVDAEFPPVPLGWGFTLNGVGGLFAMHRTAAVDALRAALKADALSTILFPKNAITNAPQILALIETLFPTAPGRFLFGPMALIGWGTPTVLTAALAVVIELPEPVTILLLARVAVRAPSESAPLVRINMDALGVLDLSNDALSLDAVLFDSRLLNYTLSGGMALRANWGSKREFLLAIGGFHPQFTPPAGFPTLQRITIDMPSGIVSKLRLSAYFALTSNTVQFGAELDVFVGADGFGLSGQLAFDALFQLDPFHFDADISGSVSIQFAGDDLASVSFTGDLSGPAPWHIAGSFKIHIVFWDVHKSFSHSWGVDAPSQTVATVDVLGLLSATLADPRSWAARLPDGMASLITARAAAGGAAAVVAHPLGLPEVHERIVPLDMDITRFGEAVPAGATRYSITGWRLGGVAPPQEAMEDDFAPAQFLDLSDDEKLARPSYEQHDAGVKMSAGLVKSGTAVAKTLAYETSYIDTPGGAPRGDPAPAPPLAPILGILALGASGRAQAMSQPYWAAGNPVVVMDSQFVLVGTDNLAPAGIGPAAGATYSDVASMLAAELVRAPDRRDALQIVATHERVSA